LLHRRGNLTTLGAPLGPQHLGFAVPVRLQTEEGELALITTLTSFATATDVALAELQLEAFLPVDEASARILRDRPRTSASPPLSPLLITGGRL